MNCCIEHADRLRDDSCPWCEITRLRAEVEALRNTLDFIAEFQNSNWPERCQENVRRARVARS